MQTRKLKDEKCFDRELWRKKLYLGVEGTCIHKNNLLIIINQNHNETASRLIVCN
jgi:hypothetical protein